MTTIENVERVIDEATCLSAARHYANIQGYAGGAVPVHVFRVGEYFLVVDPATKAGDRVMLMYFTGAWEWLRTDAT